MSIHTIHDLVFWGIAGLGAMILVLAWAFTLRECPDHWPETLVVTVIISGLGMMLYPVYQRGVQLREHHAKVKAIKAWNGAHPLSTPRPIPTPPK